MAHFLEGRIVFGQIAEAVERVLTDTPDTPMPDAETVLEADRAARAAADRALGL